MMKNHDTEQLLQRLMRTEDASCTLPDESKIHAFRLPAPKKHKNPFAALRTTSAAGVSMMLMFACMLTAIFMAPQFQKQGTQGGGAGAQQSETAEQSGSGTEGSGLDSMQAGFVTFNPIETTTPVIVEEPLAFNIGGYTAYRRLPGSNSGYFTASTVAPENYVDIRDVDENGRPLESQIPFLYDVVDPHLTPEYIAKHTVGEYYIVNKKYGTAISNAYNSDTTDAMIMRTMEPFDKSEGQRHLIVAREDGTYMIMVKNKDREWGPLQNISCLMSNTGNGMIYNRPYSQVVDAVEKWHSFVFTEASDGAYKFTGFGTPQENGWTIRCFEEESSQVHYFAGLHEHLNDGGNEWYFIPVDGSPEFQP